MGKRKIAVDVVDAVEGAAAADVVGPVGSGAGMAVDPGVFELIDVDALVPCPENPRRFVSNDPAMAELVESIRRVGVLEPLLVRPVNGLDGRGRSDGVGPHPALSRGERVFEIRAGERRFRAAKSAGLRKVPCIVRAMTDDEALEVTVTENLQRVDLHPLEESAGVRMLLARGWTFEDVGAQLGKSRKWVARRAALGGLARCWLWALGMGDDPGAPGGGHGMTWAGMVASCVNPSKFITPQIEESVKKNSPLVDKNLRVFCAAVSTWSVGHLEAIARHVASVQEEFFLRLVLDEASVQHWALEDDSDEVMLLRGRSSSDLVRDLTSTAMVLSSAIWDLDQDHSIYGSCSKCPKRSDRQEDLFSAADFGGRQGEALCLDPVCWRKKHVNAIRTALEPAREKHGQALVYMRPKGHEGYSDAPNDVLEEVLGPKFELVIYPTIVKKDTPGARPAVSVSGKSMGKVSWIAPTTIERGNGSAARNGATAQRGEGAKAEELTKEERLERKKGEIDAKREKLFVDFVGDAIRDMSGDIDMESDVVGRIEMEELVSLVAVFGCAGANERVDCLSDDEGMSSPWKWVAKLQGDEPRMVAYLLRGMASKVGVSTRLTADDARRWCRVFGIDVAELEKDAAEEYPYPAGVLKWLGAKAD